RLGAVRPRRRGPEPDLAAARHPQRRRHREGLLTHREPLAMSRNLFTIAAAFLAAPAFAHDTWVQTNTNVVRTGDAVHVDLMLGNHGNDHRDFKLASKLAPGTAGSF